MFDCRRITLFCLEKRFSKQKMTMFSKIVQGVMAPLAPLATPMVPPPMEFTWHDHSSITCSRHIYVVLFFAHIPFVVYHAINATPTERLQHYKQTLILKIKPSTENLQPVPSSQGRFASRSPPEMIGYWLFTIRSYHLFEKWYPYPLRILFWLKSYYPYLKTIWKCIMVHNIHFCALSILPSAEHNWLK